MNIDGKGFFRVFVSKDQIDTMNERTMTSFKLSVGNFGWQLKNVDKDKQT